MKIRERHLKTSGEIIKVYEYDADDEEPDCMKCIHVCDSQDICEDCGSMWLNYLRREAKVTKGEN